MKKISSISFLVFLLCSCNASESSDNKKLAETNTIAKEQSISSTTPSLPDTSIESKEIINSDTFTKDESSSLENENQVNDNVPVEKEVATIKPDKPEDQSINKDGATTIDPKITPSEKDTIKQISTQTDEISHSDFNDLLKKHVTTTGEVDYVGFKSEKAKLNSYTTFLSNNPPKESWSKNEKLAFWINAYNAFTIKLIVDNYPLKSITDLYDGKPWDQKWIKIGTNTYSLNNIENDIIRPKFKDARIHFAVNCAAKSCPKLMNEAYKTNQLDAQLNKQTEAFINSSQNDLTASEIKISKIFDWYAIDFGNVVDFLNNYSNTEINSGAQISYKEYDWALNKE